MAAFMIVMVVLVLTAGAAAFVSDRRDRRNGHDPSLRAESVAQHRKAVKEQRNRARARRLGWSGPVDEHQARDRSRHDGY